MINVTRHTHFHIQVIERGKVKIDKTFNDHNKATKFFEFESSQAMRQYRGRKVNLKRCELNKSACGVK